MLKQTHFCRKESGGSYFPSFSWVFVKQTRLKQNINIFAFVFWLKRKEI